jgi:TPP-dependent trihydroxycyclohexane-1,2-dione (THcHDO) dehydratase
MQRATSISEMPPGACDCHMHVYDGPGIVPAPFAIPDANLVRYRALIMGYEISGGWGAAMANPDRDTFVMLGDGSCLMMNSDIYSTVLTGHKIIVVVCDNGGFAVINRLQNREGGVSFNNLIRAGRVKEPFAVDFAAHAAPARSMT